MFVSIVINTFNRADSLATTLNSLRSLDFADYEVIVVNGPSTDSTSEVISSFGALIKVGNCPVRNLSRSRNIGIRLSAGEIVAFIDDDAVPDPGWLADILPLFEDREVGGAGGPVFDHTGARLQAHYLVCDRFGKAEIRFDRDPSPLLNVPDGSLFCTTLGTNSLFRRQALVEIGGFDEEYDYYLDETDVCLRMVDAGWTIRYAQSGFVYHRYLPSNVRNKARVVSDYGPVMKNRAYFAMRHAAGLFGQAAIQEALNGFVTDIRNVLTWAIEAGHLRYDASKAFEETFDVKIRQGFERAAFPRISSLDIHHSAAEIPFRPFMHGRLVGLRRLHICYISQDYPPGVVPGIARMAYELATGMAELGHFVRVITRGLSHTVDFENGVWVHRVPDLSEQPPEDFRKLPTRIWGRCAAVLDELLRIETMRPVDLVQAPNWDCEGLAVVTQARWRFVLAVYTPMRSALKHNLLWQRDKELLVSTIQPIISGEHACYERATAMLACGQAILDEVSTEYDLSLNGRLTGIVPHGLPDQGCPPHPAPDKPTVDILFVGRLEARKGIDVLLASLPSLFKDMPEIVVLLAGDDTLENEDGSTFRASFIASREAAKYRDRVRFLGMVDDETLNDLYRQADIVVVPSRFESFGLPLIEAMMRGKPVVACYAGGMADIVILPDARGAGDCGTGLLVPPGDAKALAEALRLLSVSVTSRREMGEKARVSFIEQYSSVKMITSANEFYQSVVGL